MKAKITFVHNENDWDKLAKLVHVFGKLGIDLQLEITKSNTDYKCKIDYYRYNEFTWTSPPKHT